jgi:hypothetical protein
VPPAWIAPSNAVIGKPDTCKLPPFACWEETAAGGADVVAGCGARASPRDHLIAHNLAIALVVGPIACGKLLQEELVRKTMPYGPDAISAG